ncbi:MAG: competence/damage-inducible protein A [Candidatus Firestonebacteria bacterium]
MNTEIITVGTELLLGQIIDTNFAYIAQKLSEIGVNLYFKSSVGDNEKRLQDVLRIALSRSDVVIITGGLGPTVDDITKSAVTKVLNKKLILNEKILEKIKSFFEKRKVKMPQNNVSQALIPTGSIIIDNDHGTAPGLIIKTDDNKYVILLPGVPRELKAMMENSVLPFLKETFKSEGVIKSRVLKVFGLGESVIDEKIGDLFRSLSNPTIALLASHTEVKIRLTAKAKDIVTAEEMITRVENKIRERLEDNIFGIDDETMEKVVAILLFMKNLTIGVAESCTGGLISNKLTDIPGSSSYFKRGIVAYSNEAKVELLKVPEEAIRTFGAVSKEVAEEMAISIRKSSKTNLGLSVTGLAGPSGGTSEKPVGLVYIAISSEEETLCKEFRFTPFKKKIPDKENSLTGFSGDRIKIKEQTAQSALDLLRRYLLAK